MCRTKLNVLSLFSGGGGMDLGFEGDFEVLKKSINLKINDNWTVLEGSTDDWVKLPKTTFETVFANDINIDAKKSWLNYFTKKGIGENVYHLGSIVDIVKEQTNQFPLRNTVDVVIGGFPCQDFSVSGKRKGFNSTKSHDGKKTCDDKETENRGQLYKWMKEVISIVEPKVFIAENVKGLVNLNDVKEIIEKDFRTISDGGYLIIEGKVLHSADYGVPQSRERVFFFGFKKSALTDKSLQKLSEPNIDLDYSPFPLRTHNYSPMTLIDYNIDLVEPVNVLDCFVDLAEPTDSTDVSQQSYSKAKFMGKHCQGQSEVNLLGIAPTIRSEHHGNIEYRRLGVENGGKHLDELNLGLEERRLTVRECARIQTFPDDYEFVFKGEKRGNGVSASAAYKVIGNAVPPLLSYHIAKRLEDNWDKYFK